MFKNKRHASRVIVLAAALILTASVAYAYYHGSPAVRGRTVVQESPVTVTSVTTIPSTVVSEFFGRDFNMNNFRDFTFKNFGANVEKEFTVVPTDAVIMYQLKLIIERLDGVNNVRD